MKPTIPYNYLYNIRLKSATKAISKTVIDIVTPAALLLAIEGINIYQQASYLLVALGFYALYEVGYMHNDLNKQALTERLSITEKQQLKKQLPPIIFLRILLIGTSILGAYLIYPNLNYIYGIILTISTIIIFTTYNIMPQKWNIILYPLLILCRYSTPYLFVAQSITPFTILILLLIYPLEIFIERIAWSRYNIKPLRFLDSRKSQLIFRVVYYATLFLITLIWHNPILSCVFAFYLIYRTIFALISIKSMT